MLLVYGSLYPTLTLSHYSLSFVLLCVRLSISGSLHPPLAALTSDAPLTALVFRFYSVDTLARQESRRRAYKRKKDHPQG